MAEAWAKRVLIIGLDSAEPSLVEAWRNELPALSALMDQGVHGRLTSAVPPINAHAGVSARGRLDAHLLDIAPTVLELLGHDVPADMRGRSLAGKLAA